MKKHSVLFFSALAVLFFSACNNWNPMPIPVTDIVFEPPLPAQQLSLSVGGTYQLNAKVKPDNATNKTLIYTSNNVKIAPVNDKGVIEAKQAGQAVVTIKAADNISKEITVVVTNNTHDKTEVPGPAAPIAVKSIVLSPDEDTVSLVKGTSRQLKAQVQPENATNKKLTFASSAPAIASINDEGTITAHKLGNAEITIQAANEVSKKLKVIITAAPVAVRDIVFDPALPGNSLSINAGKTCPLHAKVQPENATDKNLIYSSADDSIASVDDKGMVTAHKTGDTKITIKASNGVSKKVTVKVTVEHIPVTEITLPPSETTLSLVNGNTRYINAKVVPENATDKTLTYSSDKAAIASVAADGMITANGVGSAHITIQAADGITKIITVTVTKATVRVTSIEFEEGEPANPVELVIGESYELKLKVLPEDATNKVLDITSSNNDVAWPNGDGNLSIRAAGEGDATITITSKDNSSAKKEVHFKIKPLPSIELIEKEITSGSSELDISLEIKTLHGKLSYTPIIVGEESGWLSIDSTDTTTSTEKDTIHLKATQNKTVWKRTAYINFKDGSNKEIKNANGEKLEVKVVQKENENPNVTIRWVDGIGEPTDAEKIAIPVCPVRKENNELTTEKQFYWDSSKIFWWYESNTTKWFNNRKLLNLGVTADKNAADSNQCWAKTASNMLHWWFVQNKTHIDKYIEHKSPEEREKYQDYYKRELHHNENKSEEEKKQDKDKERDKSYIATTFRIKAHNGNKGDYIIGGLSWYLYGNETAKISRPGENDPALFKDVFSKDNTPIERINVHGKDSFNDIISKALKSKKAIGIDIWGSKGRNDYGHAITLWGAAFDEEENIIAIYVVDNNFAANRIFPYGIWYKDGKPYLFNYGVNQFVQNRYVGQVTTLDKGEDQWAEWKHNNP